MTKCFSLVLFRWDIDNISSEIHGYYSFSKNQEMMQSVATSYVHNVSF